LPRGRKGDVGFALISNTQLVRKIHEGKSGLRSLGKKREGRELKRELFPADGWGRE